MKADLHIHSRYSNDGEFGIKELFDKCSENRLDLFSITDHNSVKGSREASKLAADYPNMEFVPGIEIDCNYRGIDLHLLAYQVNLNGNEFDELEKDIRQKYLDAVPQMIRNLEQLGIDIDRDELIQRSGGKLPRESSLLNYCLRSPGSNQIRYSSPTCREEIEVICH